MTDVPPGDESRRQAQEARHWEKQFEGRWSLCGQVRGGEEEQREAGARWELFF